jgi:hypothetical protein
VVQQAARHATAGARPLRLNRYKLQLMQGLCRKALAQLASPAADPTAPAA